MSQFGNGKSEGLRETLLDLERARVKEELLRKETQAMLDCLGLLGQGIEPREMFIGVTRIFRELVGYDDVVILNKIRGKWHGTIATRPELLPMAIQGASLFRRVKAGEVVAVFEANSTEEWRGAKSKAIKEIESVLQFCLEIEGRQVIVACCHSGTGKFSRGNVNLIHRLRPLLNQALASAAAFWDRERVQELTYRQNEYLEKIKMLEQGTKLLGVGLMQWDGETHPMRPSQALKSMVRPWGNFQKWWQSVEKTTPLGVLCNELAKGRTFSVNLKNGDGGLHIFDFIACSPMGAIGGKYRPILISDRTTDHKLERDRLRAEQKYESLFRQSKDSIFLLSLAGEVLDLNQRARDIWAGSIPNSSQTWFDLVEQEDRSRFSDFWQQLSIDGEELIEVRIRAHGGDPFLAEVSANRIEIGSQKRVQLLVRDITARRMAEQALRRSEQRKGAILESSLDCIISVDSDGIIEEFNPAAEATFGWQRSEIVGKALDQTIIPIEMRAKHNRGFSNYRKTGDSLIMGKRMELPALCRDGKEILTEVTIAEIRHEDSNPRLIAFLRDITQWKDAQINLKRAKEQAESANHAKTRFLAAMSHELRTPIHVIVGLVDQLIERKLPEGLREDMSALSSSSNSLLSLIDDLLDISKIEVGEISFVTEYVELAPFLKDVGSMFGKQARDLGLEFGIQLGDNMPIAVETDSSRLRQVLLNLVNNALKFTRQGTIMLKFDHLERNGDALLISVSDTGQGIPANKLEEVFDRFVQLDRAGAGGQARGVGLGLSICREIVEFIGGEIFVDSKVGIGTTFSVVWPVKRAQPMEVSTEVVNCREQGLPVERPLTILVVDDNPGNSLLARRMLEGLGHRPICMDSGQLAVDFLRINKVDLVLLDIEMPGMDGFQTFERIKVEVESPPPVVALTAHALPGYSDKCISVGMSGYLAKPFSKADLSRIIEPFADAHQGQVACVNVGFEDLVPGYLADCITSIKNLEGYLRGGNWKASADVAHNLVGTGASYGFAEISQMGEELRACCKGQDLSGALNVKKGIQLYLKEASNRFSAN